MNSISENNSGKFKILVGVLTLLLIALAVYTITLFNDSKAKVSTLEIQKANIEGELEELIANYDEVIDDNELKDKTLLSARERISILLDSVKDAEANVALIERYQSEITRLKRERSLLFERADSLIAANKVLLRERDSSNTELVNIQIFVDSINQENKLMSETIKRGSVVRASNLRGEAVIIRRNGKVVNTVRSSRADKIRACFTLNANDIATAGNRSIYVQVINPLNNIVGGQEFIQFEEQNIFYSATTDVYYENEELDVCVMVDVNDTELIEGDYTFKVFDGPSEVATTVMTLR